MSNQDVAKMVEAGLPEDIVIAAIKRATERAFDLSASGLVALNARGVPGAVLRVMMDPTGPSQPPVEPQPAAPAAPAPEPPTVPMPTEIGVYAISDGKLIEVQPEIVNWRTGGFLKSMATAGIKGPHVNGWVSSPASRLQVPHDAELLIMTPEGFAATEYQLLRLNTKKDRREFRTMTMGMLGAKGGSSENAVVFESEKRAPRTFAIRATEELKPGEYGILPPGAGAAGKLYTFTVK